MQGKIQSHFSSKHLNPSPYEIFNPHYAVYAHRLFFQLH